MQLPDAVSKVSQRMQKEEIFLFAHFYCFYSIFIKWDYIFEIAFCQLFLPYHSQHNKEGKENNFPPEAVDSPTEEKWPYVLYLFHVNYIPLVFSQVTHKRDATDTGMGVGQAGKRRKREGEERWMKVSLSIVKAGGWALCNGLSRSCFRPLELHFKSSPSVVKWYP